MNIQIYEEATNWLIKHRETDLNPQEKQEFDSWLRESPQHVRAYLEMSAIWESVPALDSSCNPTSDELIARARSEGNVYPFAETDRVAARDFHSQPSFNHSAEKEPLESEASVRRTNAVEVTDRGVHASRRMKPFALAASFLIVIVGVTIWYWLNRNTYETDIGEQRSIVLTDGSTVELNSRSRVRVRYTDTQRDVDLLDGQALFRVAHNAKRPFVVHSGVTNVRAVGTQFDVYKKRAGTVVTVVEGKVAVLANTLQQRDSPQTPGSGATAPDLSIRSGVAATASRSDGGNTVFLAAGEQLTVPAVKPSQVRHSAAAESPQHANVAAATAWMRRTLVFDSSPLTEVAEEFNRYNTRQLIITDPEVANIRISGVFSSVDPALLLKFLRGPPELNVEETATEIRISKK